MTGMLAMTGCKSKDHGKIDLTSLHTTAAEETMESTTAGGAETESTVETEGPASSEASENKGGGTAAGETSGKGSSSAQSIATKLETYKSGKVSIEYPVISNMKDSALQTKVNELVKSNATAIVKAYEMDEASDTADIKCKVVSSDRKRVSLVYTGSVSGKDSAHPTGVFYTNTIDLDTGKDLGFSDFADPYTMAGYLLSDDVEFADLSADDQANVKEVIRGESIEYYTDLFKNADFPLSGTAFPESFSYEKQGVLYFSVPVNHALGDYVVVKYATQTK